MATINLATLLVKLVADSKEFKKGVGDAQKSGKDFGSIMKKAVGGAAVAAFGVATKAAVDFAKESIAEFQQFNKGMREVFTLMPGITEQAMGQMEGDVLAFSESVGRTTDETVPALYQAISAGVPPDNVFDFMQIASDAALGGVTDLETAVDGISSAVNAYGEEALGAQQASDLMFTAVKGGKTTFEELSGSMFNVIPTAASLNVEFGNITAALASMTAQGVPTSVATTQLRQLLVELSKEGSEAAATFEKLAGKSFREFIAEGGNLQGALQIMEQGAADLDIGINDLFGSVEAGSAALALTGEGTAKFTQELNAATDAAGATAEAAEVMAGSLEHLEAVSNATTEALKIQTGEAIEPAKRQWLELKIAVGEYFNEDLQLRNQLLSSTAALEEYGYSGESLRKALGALGEGTTLWRDSLVDAETMANRTAIATNLLEEGWRGSADELGKAVRRIEEADNASNDYVNTLDDLNQMAAEQAAAQEEANRAQQEWIDMGGGAVGAATDYSVSLEELARMGRDAALAQREELAVAAEEAQIAAEEAAAAEREQAQALAELKAQTGDYFDTALQAGEGASSFEEQLYNAANAAGAGATELAILAAATGNYTDEEIEAAFQAALMRENIEQLAQAVAAGTLTSNEAVDALGLLKTGTADSATEAINLASGAYEAAAGLEGLSGEAINAANNLNNIPSDIPVHISITSDPVPSLPNVPSGGQATKDQAFALGGFTGGNEGDIVGLVHGQEFVFSAPAVRSIGLPALEMLHQQGLTGGGNNNFKGIVNNNFYGQTDATAVGLITQDAQLTAFRKRGMR